MKKYRLHYLPVLHGANEFISSRPLDSEISRLVDIDGREHYYVTPLEFQAANEFIYNLPVLFEKDGSIWLHGCLFLYSFYLKILENQRDPKHINRIAGCLLDYKIWCEDQHVDLLDFSGRRPIHRPSYRYYLYLRDLPISPGNKAQRTSVVYDFYEFASGLPGVDIDLDKVDQVELKTVFFTDITGNRTSKSIRSRTQSFSVPRGDPIDDGCIKDEGEVLRPLSEKALELLARFLFQEDFPVDHRLIFSLGLDVGLRKQTILTLRMKHLKSFVTDNLITRGVYRGHYKFNAGPGQGGDDHTGIDTKFNKRLTLYMPEKLGKRLIVYANSPLAIRRRSFFRAKYGNILSNSDMYVFLSEKGNCHYMSKTDPRYKMVASPPVGHITTDLTKKVTAQLKQKGFPTNFTFHWTRATYALRWFKYLEPSVISGHISTSSQISIVQGLLGHKHRMTTESYLKLHLDSNEGERAQEMFEERLLAPFDCIEDEAYDEA